MAVLGGGRLLMSEVPLWNQSIRAVIFIDSQDLTLTQSAYEARADPIRKAHA